MLLTYHGPVAWTTLRWAILLIGIWQGVFALFTMCLPPLFPVLLRTTGAGFCYNFGRIISAAGVVAFGYAGTIGSSLDDTRHALFYSSFLFFPAALLAVWLPRERPSDDLPTVPRPQAATSPT
jgi:hypothetical protein